MLFALTSRPALGWIVLLFSLASYPDALLDRADLRSELHFGTLLDCAAYCAGLHAGTSVSDHSQLILRVLCILCVLSLWLDANLFVAQACCVSCVADFLFFARARLALFTICHHLNEATQKQRDAHFSSDSESELNYSSDESQSEPASQITSHLPRFRLQRRDLLLTRCFSVLFWGL